MRDGGPGWRMIRHGRAEFRPGCTGSGKSSGAGYGTMASMHKRRSYPIPHATIFTPTNTVVFAPRLFYSRCRENSVACPSPFIHICLLGRASQHHPTIRLLFRSPSLIHIPSPFETAPFPDGCLVYLIHSSLYYYCNHLSFPTDSVLPLHTYPPPCPELCIGARPRTTTAVQPLQDEATATIHINHKKLPRQNIATGPPFPNTRRATVG